MVYLSISLCHLCFIHALLFSVHQSLPSLGRFIPRNFTLLVAMVNGIASLVSIFDVLLLLYRKARVFRVLILYPATSLKSLISSSHFLVASLVSLGMVSHHGQTVAVSPLLFQFVWKWFSSFPLIAVTRSPKTILNNNGESGHLCLILNLRGHAFTIGDHVCSGFIHMW